MSFDFFWRFLKAPLTCLKRSEQSVTALCRAEPQTDRPWSETRGRAGLLPEHISKQLGVLCEGDE